MGLQRVSYTDQDGRKKVVLLPEGVSEDEAAMGIPIGPPSLDELGLPLESEVRLNNELFNRGIFTAVDAIKRRADIIAAIQATFKVDASRIVTVYTGGDYQNAKQEKVTPLQPTPQQVSRNRRRR